MYGLIRKNQIFAKARIDRGQWTILKGSKFLSPTPSLPPNASAERELAEAKGEFATIPVLGRVFILNEDFECSVTSPSAVGSICTGRACNGPEEWNEITDDGVLTGRSYVECSAPLLTVSTTDQDPACKPDVVIVTVSKLLRVDGDKNVEIAPDEYKHTESFLPSRNVRAVRKGREFPIGIVVGVPKRTPHPKKNKNSTAADKGPSNNGVLPTCERDPDILGDYDPKRGIFRINTSNSEMVGLFTGSGLKVRNTDSICKYATDAYMRLKTLAASICNHAQLITISVPEKFTREDSSPKYLIDNYDFLINRVLADFFNQDPGMIELREKIAKERQRIESQMRVDENAETEEIEEVEETAVEEPACV